MSVNIGSMFPDQKYRDAATPMTVQDILDRMGLMKTYVGTNEVIYPDMENIIARLIFSEGKRLDEQKGIARSIFNRYITLREVTSEADLRRLNKDRNILESDLFGRYIRPGYSYDITFHEDLYKKIVYDWAPDDNNWHYHGIDDEEACDPLRNETPAVFTAWKQACDLAYCLVNFIDFNSSPVSNQMNYTGYEAKEIEPGVLLRDKSDSEALLWINNRLDDNRTNGNEWHDTQATLYTGFYNNKYWEGNSIGSLKLSAYAFTPPNTGDEQINLTRIPDQNASEFVAFLRSRVGCGYAYGAYGQMCDDALIDRLKTKNPSQASNLEISREKWCGRYVTDCSGLIKWYLLKKGIVNCDTNANGMYKDWCKFAGTTTTMPPVLSQPGREVVFRLNDGKAVHIGVHAGHNKIIEAKGCHEGVVVTEYIPSAWHAWGCLDWVFADIASDQYPILSVVADASTIASNLGSDEGVSGIQSYNTATSSVIYREGDSGPEIEMIRRRLWAEDNSIPVNDYFDGYLTAKIQAFQTANSLTADGLVGSSTWRKLFPVLQKKVGRQNGALAMQTLLNYQGYLVGTPDGLFGTGTETVLKAYQEAHELDADGICGDKTWRSLTLDTPSETQVIVPEYVRCQLGDVGDVVRMVQNRLSMWRYTFPQPGAFDSYTEQKVKEFQNLNGISQDGIVGEITWKKMFPLLKKAYGVRDQVDYLQRALVYHRHIVTIDGMFGSNCEEAVIAYQTMRGLTADGIVGEATWMSLFLDSPTGEIKYFNSSSGSTSSGTIYRFGDNDPAVRQVKRRLNADGWYSGTINTEFGRDLEIAVKNFQSSYNARVDGLIGKVTWGLLFPIVKKKTGQQDGAKAVQALLNLNGYNVGTPDGLFGTGSETALKQFQAANGLTVDGICGANTWEKLCLI